MNLVDRTKTRMRASEPVLSITRPGVIRLSNKLGEIMDLDDGAYIRFFEDKRNPKEWYIKKANEGVRIRMHQSAFFANSAYLANEIAFSLKKTFPLRFRVASEPTEGYYAIITLSGEK